MAVAGECLECGAPYRQLEFTSSRSKVVGLQLQRKAFSEGYIMVPNQKGQHDGALSVCLPALQHSSFQLLETN